MKEFFECCHKRSALDSRFVLKGAEAQYAPDRTFDTEHIMLDLDLDIPGKALSGLCTTTLRAISDDAGEMVFDAVDFHVKFVRSNQGAVSYQYNKRQLTVQFKNPIQSGDVVQIQIGYRVTRPKLGLYFIGPDKHYPHKPVQVWTQGEDEFARYWFPCHDAPQDRTSTEILVKVPKGMTAVSNGRLVKKSPLKNKIQFHWKQDIPHAAYLVTLAVGHFTEIKDHWKNIPVTYYCTPGREQDTRRAFGKTPKMMAFFSKKTGQPYPYPKYAQVAAEDFIYGGMENTSATTQTAKVLHDERAHLDFSADYLAAHELAHQWFGDLITCQEWSHAWLNESFATYFEALFTEHDRGKDEFFWELRQNAAQYFEEDKSSYRRPLVSKVYKSPTDLFDRHLYEKGSLILHMLRCVLGETAFWTSIQTYVKDNKGLVVETIDFKKAVEKATGKNMGRFFDQWVYKAGHPEYKVRYWWESSSKKAYVRVAQTQKTDHETGLFSMPVVFSFHTSKGEKRFTELVDKKTHLFEFKLPAEPYLVLFDPDHGVLKKTDFPKSETMWTYQLTHDPHVLGRREAAMALGKINSVSAVQALSEALIEEKFWGVQGEIGSALGQISTPEAVEALLYGLKTITHPKARRPCLSALGGSRSACVREELQKFSQTEKSYFTENASLLARGKSGDMSLIAEFPARMKRESWNDILRCGALEAMTALQPPGLVSILKKHTAYGHSHSLRLTAVRCLAKIGAGRADVQTHLLALMNDPYLLVQLNVVKALTDIGNEQAVPVLKKFTKGDYDGRLIRMAEEAVLKLNGHDGE